MLLYFSFFTASTQTDATHPILGYQKKIFPSISEDSLLLLVISYSHVLTCCYFLNIIFVESHHFDQMIIYFSLENHCYLSTHFAAFVLWLLSLKYSNKSHCGHLLTQSKPGCNPRLAHYSHVSQQIFSEVNYLKSRNMIYSVNQVKGNMHSIVNIQCRDLTFCSCSFLWEGFVISWTGTLYLAQMPNDALMLVNQNHRISWSSLHICYNT